MIGGEAIRIGAPAQLPVSILEVKAQTSLDGIDTYDALLQSYLETAVETAEEETGLALITQTWQQSFPEFATEMRLARRPVIAVGSPPVAVTVQYLDTDEVLQTVADTVYWVTGIGAATIPATVKLANGQNWPVSLTHNEAVRITYTAGFGNSAGAVPQPIRQAIRIAAATWFAFREEVVMGSTVSDPLPFASKALLRPYRRLAVA